MDDETSGAGVHPDTPRRLTFNGPANDVIDPVTGHTFVPGVGHDVTQADVDRLTRAFPNERWNVVNESGEEV